MAKVVDFGDLPTRQFAALASAVVAELPRNPPINEAQFWIEGRGRRLLHRELRAVLLPDRCFAVNGFAFSAPRIDALIAAGGYADIPDISSALFHKAECSGTRFFVELIQFYEEAGIPEVKLTSQALKLCRPMVGDPLLFAIQHPSLTFEEEIVFLHDFIPYSERDGKTLVLRYCSGKRYLYLSKAKGEGQYAVWPPGTRFALIHPPV